MRVRRCWAFCDPVLTPKQMPAVNVAASSLPFNNAKPKPCFFKPFVLMDAATTDFSRDGNWRAAPTYFHSELLNKTGGAVFMFHSWSLEKSVLASQLGSVALVKISSSHP